MRIPSRRASHPTILVASLAAWLVLALAPAGASGDDAPILKVKARSDKELAHRGEPIGLTFQVEVREGWHVNADRPSLPELIPTRVVLHGPDKLRLEKLAYPQASTRTFSFLEKPIRVLEGSFTIQGTARFADDAPAGLYAVKGAVEYQACNDAECLPPATAAFSVPIMLIMLAK